MAYDREYLNQISCSVNLLEYAKQSMDFEQRGENWFTRCPSKDHDDRTPSLCINPRMNRYKCFACGRSGTIINWLRDYEGLSFENAVQKAASLGNVQDKCIRSKTLSINKSLINMHLKPCTHQTLELQEYERFKKELPKEWIEEGISEAAMNRYRVRIAESAQRIVYPVFDSNGNFINVKGRTRLRLYKELKLPKYINYYKVGKLDYFQGWQQAIKNAKEKNEIIVFEGIKSCMKAFDFGFRNTISAECHEINDYQMRLLISLGVDVVVAFDSDVNIYNDAIYKQLKKLSMFLNVYVVFNPDMLGGADAKNSPVDLGCDIWNKLYAERYKL